MEGKSMKRWWKGAWRETSVVTIWIVIIIVVSIVIQRVING